MTNMPKEISLIVPIFNGTKYIKQFIDPLNSNIFKGQVIFVDNCSTDNSVSWFKSKYPNLLCIQLDKNYGYAEGYNKGLKHVKNKYYALLNTDLIVTKNWLTPLIKKLETNSKIGVIQPHILDFNNKNYFEYAGAAGGYIDKYGFPYCRGRIFKTIEFDKGQYDLPKEIFEASEKLTINSSWQDTFKSYLRSEYKKGSVDITKITDADYEECLIKFAMEICNGKKIEAAKLLGWGRNTIANKIKNIT